MRARPRTCMWCRVDGLASGRREALDVATTRAWLDDPALNQSVMAFNVGAYFGLAPERTGAALGRLVELVACGRVRGPVTTRLPLAQAADAHGLIEAREALGKVVLEPWSCPQLKGSARSPR